MFVADRPALLQCPCLGDSSSQFSPPIDTEPVPGIELVLPRAVMPAPILVFNTGINVVGERWNGMTSTGSDPTTWLSRTDVRETIRVGLIGGLVGGVCIWIYEAVVWVGVQHQMPLAGIPSNATGLTFGQVVQTSLGIRAYVLGTLIHFAFALGWGVAFAAIWPYFRPPRDRGHAGRAALCDAGMDRDARIDHDRVALPPQLRRLERGDRRVHVALLLRGAASARGETTTPPSGPGLLPVSLSPEATASGQCPASHDRDRWLGKPWPEIVVSDRWNRFDWADTWAK